MRLLNPIRSFFSTPTATVLVLGLAILSRILQLVFFYNIHFDPSFQVIATENLLNGHGISISTAAIEDLSTTIYKPLIMWPPGYSLLLAPLYALFNHNYIIAGLTLDILFAVILLFSCRAILKTLLVELWLINLFTLLCGFFIYFFYFMASSDAIAISLFSVAILHFLLLLQEGNNKLRSSIIFSVCLALCSLLKYLFIPVAFILPLFLLIYSYRNKIASLQKTAFFAIAVIAIVIGITLLYQESNSGQTTFISAAGRGFYPEHLLQSYPFIPASFLNPATISSFTANNSIENNTLFIFRLIHLVLLIALVIYFLREVRSSKLKSLTLSDQFFYSSFLLSLAIVAVLSFLSIRVEKELILTGFLWTYVQEARYYGLITVLLHLSLFILFQRWLQAPKRMTGYILFFFFILLMPEFFRGVLFSGKRLLKLGKEEYSWQWENRFQQYADNIIQQEKGKTAFANILVTGPVYYLNNRVSIYSNAATLPDATVLNDLDQLKTKQPVLLLAIIDSADSKPFEPFLANTAKELAGQFDRFYFYRVYVNPR